MLYHYTDIDSARLILQDGLIKRRPLLVMSELLGGQEIRLEPVVWLTINPILDGTVAVSLAVLIKGWSLERLCRFSVADAVAPLSLPEWAAKHGHDADMFRHMVYSASLVGTHYTCWRLAEEDVPRQQWLGTHRWQGEGAGAGWKEWQP